MKRLIIALAALSFLPPLTGCGQSGPLYLPDDPSRIEVAPPAPAEEEEEEQADAPSD
ncbi:MAG: hypothetical protein KJO01_13265 [Gammaproteobacteria bacterium]|nr:hypothetical protein [Gammaproteobacteria bacterium]MBT8111348.1 hypothetical protein [Gammaproteobacteria bacterium]NND46107.1 hypothetical protein [Woeseiaceae bacterium]NNL46046.1 hypothetical protein [Woeseiaceae bacterium]